MECVKVFLMMAGALFLGLLTGGVLVRVVAAMIRGK